MKNAARIGAAREHSGSSGVQALGLRDERGGHFETDPARGRGLRRGLDLFAKRSGEEDSRGCRRPRKHDGDHLQQFEREPVSANASRIAVSLGVAPVSGRPVANVRT